jgi:hypothetical protein
MERPLGVPYEIKKVFKKILKNVGFTMMRDTVFGNSKDTVLERANLKDA